MSQAPQVPLSDDFYLHVNSKWLSDPLNAIPSEYPSWGGFTKLHDESLKTQIKMLETVSQKPKEERSSTEHKLALIWTRSLERFAKWDQETPSSISREDYTPILEEFQNLKTIFGETPDDQREYIQALAHYVSHSQTHSISSPLNFDQGTDLKSSDDLLLDLAASGLSLPGRDYYFEESYAPQRELFREHLKNVQNLLTQVDIPLEDDFVEKVITFETKLAQIVMKNDQKRSYKDYYTNTTLSDVYLRINELNFLQGKLENYPEDQRTSTELSKEEIELAGVFFNTIYEDLNLRSILEANYRKHYLNEDPKQPLPDVSQVERICVYDGDYFRRVLRILFDPSEKSHLVAYFQYKVVHLGNGFCTKALNEEIFDFYTRKLTGQKEQKSSEKRSVQLVNSWAGELLGQQYVEQFFSLDSKRIINQMVDTILEVMRDSLSTNDWLSESTKEKALLKLAKFTKKIGFPDKWKDYSSLELSDEDSLFQMFLKVAKFDYSKDFVEKINAKNDRTEWLMTPQTVNAYFNPCNNEIVFPAAILQPPFYVTSQNQVDFDFSASEPLSEEDLLMASNFGAIGAVIAHEITHGYDDQGRNFDGDGNLNDWWTDEDAKSFESKAALLSPQVEQFEFSVENTPYRMNHELTAGENLADLGGLSLAKKALLKYSEGKAPDVVEKCLAVLFKSWANIWKLNISEQYQIKLLSVDPHAPCSFRGNLVKNIEEFYTTFGIKDTDKMFLAPEKRVNMW